MICKTTIVAWLTSMMLSWIPAYVTDNANAVETRDEMKDRFTEIADDVYDVVKEDGNIFYGNHADIRSMWAILGTSHHETRWAKEVDVWTHEDTHVIKDGAWCLMQIQLGKKKIYLDGENKDYIVDSNIVTLEGWSGRDLVADRKKCLKVGYRMIKQSFGACRNKPMSLWMAAYASGSCDRGHVRSRELMSEILGMTRPIPKQFMSCCNDSSTLNK